MELMSIDNILDFAICHEQQSVAFYGEMAVRMESEFMRGVFDCLQEEERVHVQILDDMKRYGTPIGNTTMQVTDVTDDYPQGAELAIAAALSLALMREKQSFKLYFRLSQRAMDEGSRNIFLELARQEASHKLQLELAMETQGGSLGDLDNFL
jgi:rubrerythrin